MASEFKKVGIFLFSIRLQSEVDNQYVELRQTHQACSAEINNFFYIL